MKRAFNSARDKVEKAKGEVYRVATQQLVTGGTLGTQGHAEFKDEKGKKEKRK